jgi:hypothetical protein
MAAAQTQTICGEDTIGDQSIRRDPQVQTETSPIQIALVIGGHERVSDQQAPPPDKHSPAPVATGINAGALRQLNAAQTHHAVHLEIWRWL